MTLALGLGGNTATFSLIDAFVLRPLPVQDPERLFTVTSGSALAQRQFSPATWDALRTYANRFDGALAWGGPAHINATIGTETTTVDALFVSGDSFETLGVHTMLGRPISVADEVSGGGPAGAAVVLGYGFWQSHFGGRSDVIGSALDIEHVSARVVGVAPRDFYGLEPGRSFDLALPSKTRPMFLNTATDPDELWLNLIVRLKPGVPLSRARGVLAAIQPEIRRAALPRDARARQAFLTDPLLATPLAASNSAPWQRYRQPLMIVFAVGLLVLLIACANVSNLLLARAMANRHELAVQMALGAPRWLIAWQVAAEGVWLCLIGTIAGAAVAVLFRRAVASQMTVGVTPLTVPPSIDWHLTAFMIGSVTVVAVLAGSVPALRVLRIPPSEVLKTAGRIGAGGGRPGYSDLLVVGQLAITLLLVVFAVIFSRLFLQLTQVHLGFDSDRVLVLPLEASRATVPPGGRNRFYQQLVDTVAATPGVQAAAGSDTTPILGNADLPLRVAGPTDSEASSHEQTGQVHDCYARMGYRVRRAAPCRSELHCGRFDRCGESRARQPGFCEGVLRSVDVGRCLGDTVGEADWRHLSRIEADSGYAG
jgi:putative ABC transport system permease protein